MKKRPFHLPSLPPSERQSSLCGETAKATRSLGKEESARGEEPLFKAVFASRTFVLLQQKKPPINFSERLLPYEPSLPERSDAAEEEAREHL